MPELYIAFPLDLDNNPLIPDGPFKKSLMNLSNETSYERRGSTSMNDIDVIPSGGGEGMV